jgi:hypothetical protein
MLSISYFIFLSFYYSLCWPLPYFETWYQRTPYHVLVSLAQLIGTMHNICKVWGLNSGHTKKKTYSISLCSTNKGHMVLHIFPHLAAPMDHNMLISNKREFPNLEPQQHQRTTLGYCRNLDCGII